MCFKIYENQKSTIATLLDNVRSPDKKRYQILLAQMQSGKSGIFICFAIELILRGIIDNVYIITGSRDIELKKQLECDTKQAIRYYRPISKQEKINDISNKRREIQDISDQIRDHNFDRELFMEFDTKKNELQTEIDKLQTEIEEIDVHMKEIEENIHIIWSQDMKKTNQNIKKCLIIHEESHHAQSKNNIPYKHFYDKNDLKNVLHGDFSELDTRDIYILNVSATPFSEIIANKATTHIYGLDCKTVVLCEPGDDYKGVHHFHDTGHIRYVNKNHLNMQYLKNTMEGEKNRVGNRYIIVRTKCAEKDYDEIKRISVECDYGYISIFGSSENGFDVLTRRPEKPTVVHICGKARMGQRLPHGYIAIAFELSKKPNTDTILQGLLGRMCGYYKPLDNVNDGYDTPLEDEDDENDHLPIIYISDHSRNDINKYIDTWNNLDESCISQIKNATNIKHKKNIQHIEIDKDGKKWVKIVPFKLNSEQGSWSNNIEDNEAILTAIHQGLEDNYITHNNNDYDIQQIKSSILRITKENISYRRKARIYDEDKLKENIDNHISSKCRYTYKFMNCITMYNTTDIKQFTIYHHDDNNIYVMGYIPYDETHHIDIIENNPTVEVINKCNYIQTDLVIDEDEDIIIPNFNGGQIITFPFNETHNNYEKFKENLMIAVCRTIVGNNNYINGCSKCIVSMTDIDRSIIRGTSCGIYLISSIFTDEKIRNLREEIKEFYNVTIKFKKASGRNPNGFKKFKSITW